MGAVSPSVIYVYCGFLRELYFHCLGTQTVPGKQGVLAVFLPLLLQDLESPTDKKPLGKGGFGEVWRTYEVGHFMDEEGRMHGYRQQVGRGYRDSRYSVAFSEHSGPSLNSRHHDPYHHECTVSKESICRQQQKVTTAAGACG